MFVHLSKSFFNCFSSLGWVLLISWFFFSPFIELNHDIGLILVYDIWLFFFWVILGIMVFPLF